MKVITLKFLALKTQCSRFSAKQCSRQCVFMQTMETCSAQLTSFWSFMMKSLTCKRSLPLSRSRHISDAFSSATLKCFSSCNSMPNAPNSSSMALKRWQTINIGHWLKTWKRRIQPLCFSVLIAGHRKPSQMGLCVRTRNALDIRLGAPSASSPSKVYISGARYVAMEVTTNTWRLGLVSSSTVQLAVVTIARQTKSSSKTCMTQKSSKCSSMTIKGQGLLCSNLQHKITDQNNSSFINSNY